MPVEKTNEINRLKIEIGRLRSSATVNESELEQLRAEVGRLKAENFSLLKEKEMATEDNAKLKANISQLQSDKVGMQEKIQTLESELVRPKLSPEQLAISLRDAMVKMDEGLKIVGERVSYTVGRFDADIKASLSVDGNTVYIKLPYLRETVAPENLSTMKLSIKGVPKPRISLIRVPLLVGKSRDSAVMEIEKLGLKPVIEERQSRVHPGIIIDQEPQAYTEVTPEVAITIIVAIPEKVKVPNLVTMSMDMAIMAIKELDLVLGKVEHKLKKVAPSTVIDQSPLPDTEVGKGSSVDLVVSVQGVKVPDVKGMKVNEAEETIREMKLAVGRILYRRHPFMDGLVVAQSLEPGSKVVPASRMDLTVGERMSFQEIKELMKSHPGVGKTAAIIDSVFAALERLGMDKAETLKDLLSAPEDELTKRLGLKKKADLINFKKIMKRILEG